MKKQRAIYGVDDAAKSLQMLPDSGSGQGRSSDQHTANGPDPLDAFKFEGARIVGDITAPLYTDEEWEQFFQAKAAKFDAAADDSEAV